MAGKPDTDVADDVCGWQQSNNNHLRYNPNAGINGTYVCACVCLQVEAGFSIIKLEAGTGKEF